ncbi:MAG: hypothetical protein H6Q17_711 [Bacteroidetes bacterium]|nr:hypothetical protein [Bacteroidota bacterium]
MPIFRRLLKSRYLRMVNLLGQALIFASLLLSYTYVKHELNYDRFNINADRMARFMIKWSQEPIVESRVFDNGIDDYLKRLPELEQITKLSKYYCISFLNNGKPEVLNNVYSASANFFTTFSYPLLSGDRKSVLNSPNKVVISEALAHRLFGKESPLGKPLKFINNRKIADTTLFISGIFKDFPENSHFHTEMILPREKEQADFAYTYLVFKNKNTDRKAVEQKLTAIFNKENKTEDKATAILLPLTDIHLKAHYSCEMEPNGNINFIYLVAGANLLLTLIIFLNIWLNAGLIFASRRRYYQLLRLNGATTAVILREEFLLALASTGVAILSGALVAWLLSPLLHVPLTTLSVGEELLLTVGFFIIVTIVSLLPVLRNISTTLFTNSSITLRPSGHSLPGIRYLLTIQYVVVMLIVILTCGISKQVSLIMQKQIGGQDSCTIVLQEQPSAVKDRFPILKSELLKHSEIEAVTAAMQLPGQGIRDALEVTVEGNKTPVITNLLVVGDDFIPYFGLKLLAGSPLPPDKYTAQQHLSYILNTITGKPNPQGLSEEYVINRKAMVNLGFKSPDEAIGKTISLDKRHQLSYIPGGKICGVVEDFTYTSIFEKNIPLLIFPIAFYAQCFMIKLNGNNRQKSLQVFLDTWKRVNPEYPPNYIFLKDEYGRVYHNELNAETLVRLFSLLCLLITNLGLLVFVSFVVKNRTREIAIRRVNGASVWQIVRLLNFSYIRWIGVAFVIAVPVGYYLLQKWLTNFAYKTTLDWWIFALAGGTVLILSVGLVSWQIWRAANFNPVDSLKTE